MPTYLYQEILKNGDEGACFEWIQSITEPALTTHPSTGNPVRKLFTPPHLGTKHTSGQTKKMLDPKNIERAGFTQYNKDPLTGKYHKTVGDKGPDVLKKPPA